MKARSRPAGQLSETTTIKFGGNQILTMKIRNSLLNKCFHGKALFTLPLCCQLLSWDAVQLGRQCPGEPAGLGQSTEPVFAFSIFYLCGLAHEMHEFLTGSPVWGRRDARGWSLSRSRDWDGQGQCRTLLGILGETCWKSSPHTALVSGISWTKPWDF